MNQIRTGHLQSGGAAINLVLGFVPSYFKIINEAAADGEVMAIEWFGAEQGDGKTFKTYKHVASGFATTDATMAVDNSTGWIAAYDAASVVSSPDPVKVAGGKGVTIHADFSDDNDELWYIAIGPDRDVDHGDVA